MDRELKRQDSIDCYVRGEMSVDERQAFEQLMSTDGQLASDVDLLRRATLCAADIAAKRRVIDAWEQTRQAVAAYPAAGGRMRKVVALVVSAAACVAIGFLLVTGSSSASLLDGCDLGLDETAVRGAMPSSDVAALITDKDYGGAMELITVESEELEQEKTLTSEDSEMVDEERQYTLDLIDSELYRLQWMRIIALVGLRHEDEALVLLDDFVKTDGQHRQAAETLLMRLRGE